MTNNKKAGFAMLEVLLFVMLFMIMASFLFASVSSLNRHIRKEAESGSSRDAAVAAVRIMAGEVMKGSANGLKIAEGMKLVETEICAVPEDGSGYVKMPVWIWSERDGSRLILYGKSVSDGHSQILSLTMEHRGAEEEKSRTGKEKDKTATSSGAEPKEWRLVRYDRVEE